MAGAGPSSAARVPEADTLEQSQAGEESPNTQGSWSVPHGPLSAPLPHCLPSPLYILEARLSETFLIRPKQNANFCAKPTRLLIRDSSGQRRLQDARFGPFHSFRPPTHPWNWGLAFADGSSSSVFLLLLSRSPLFPLLSTHPSPRVPWWVLPYSHAPLGDRLGSTSPTPWPCCGRRRLRAAGAVVPQSNAAALATSGNKGRLCIGAQAWLRWPPAQFVNCSLASEVSEA